MHLPLPRLGRILLAALLLGPGRLAADAETDPPVVEAAFPEPGAVHGLPTVEIHFSEAVTGVDAADLEANGLPCLEVRRVNPDIYVFTLPTLGPGDVELKWRSEPGITDLADVPNPFTAREKIEYTLLPPLRPGGVIISELMADNQKTLRDEDGDYEDWIELQNVTDAPIALDGWHLTDEPDQLTKWTFPEANIPARGFLVLFASAKDRTNPTNRLHTNFRLNNGGEYLALTAPDGAIVSDFAPRYPGLARDVAFGRANGASEATGFFASPTPGGANSFSGAGFAPDVLFSIPGQLTLASNLVLTLGFPTPVPDAQIRFTLNGALPALTNGEAYAGPINLNLSNATIVRARAFRPNFLPGPVHSETYTHLLPSRPGPVTVVPDIREFRSDLPLLVINSYGRAPNETANIPVNFTLFEPRDGVATVTNPPVFQTRGSMKVRGSSSAGLNKKQYAIQWTDEFNQDVEHPVLGMPAESEWVLYAPNEFEPVCIHNPFIFQLSREIGDYAPRTRFVEVFLNRTGPLGTNQYQGLYVLTEKIGVGSGRIPGPKMQPEDKTLPDVSGPYVMKIDRLDPGDSGVSAGGLSVAMITPKEKELQTAARAPQKKFLTTFLNAMNKGFDPANRRNPTNGYAAYIEMSQAIDYHIIEMLSGNVDTMVLSAYFNIPRGGKLIFGPHWDFDRALGSTDGRDANPRNWQSGPVFNNWYGLMFRDIEAWQLWVDRFQQLRTNELSVAYTSSLMDRLANEIRQAERRDFAKWKIARRGGSYQAELNSMKRWVSNRLDFVDRQLAQPPVPDLPSGLVVPGTIVTLTFGPNPSTNAVIWYTLDGTDPRALGTNNPSPGAIRYTGPIVINGHTRLVARTSDVSRRQTAGPPSSTPWSSPVSRTYVTNPPPVLLTELHFHPAPAPDGQPFQSDDFEFLELKNTSGAVLDLAGFQLAGDVSFTFPQDRPGPRLQPNERILLVENTNAFASRYGSPARVAGEYLGKLSDRRGRLRLTDAAGAVVFDFAFFDQWYRPADGDGYSLVVRSERLAAYELDSASAWVASARIHGSPGGPDLGSDAAPDTDSDGDGLPDAWELVVFRNLTHDGVTDDDLDGYSNRDEFIAGSDPGLAGSRPALEAIPSPFGGNPVLRFTRFGARTYRLQSRDTLDAPWSELLLFPAELGASGQFRDLTTTNASRFYRLATP